MADYSNSSLEEGSTGQQQVQIEMEKVPQLDIFSHRQAKKSNSLSRLGVNNSLQRPTSSFQTGQSFFKGQNYYGTALRILNQNKQPNFRRPQHYCEEELNKTNIKKISRNQIQEKTIKINQQHIQQAHQINCQPTKNIVFKYTDSNKIIEEMHQIPSGFSLKTIVNENIPKHFIPQQQFQQPSYIQHIPQQSNHLINSQKNLQKSNSMQVFPDMHLKADLFHRKDEIINNQEQQVLRGSKNHQKAYTFNEIDSKKEIPQKKINRLFTFDATYLLQVKQSEQKLAAVCQFALDKTSDDEQNKKRQLLDELIEIKEDNIHEGVRIIGQLNSLIEQFQSKPTFQLSDSTMRSSRRSMFSKIK